MRKNFLLAACATIAIAAASVGTANAQSANLITNGDFSGTLLPAASTGSVVSSSVATYMGAGYGATNGYPFLGCSGPSPCPISTSTSFAALQTNASTVTVQFLTTAGTNYQLTFANGYFTTNYNSGNENLLFSVSGAVSKVLNGSSQGGEDGDFADLFMASPSIDFTGTGGYATITFTSSTNLLDLSAGSAMLLTNVDVQNIPEPSTFALALTGIIGLAGLGFARSRSRKSI